MMKNEKGSKIGNGKWIGSENNDGNEQRAKMRMKNGQEAKMVIENGKDNGGIKKK